MKLQLSIIISLLTCCMACNNNAVDQQEETKTEETKKKDTLVTDAYTATPIPLDGCYKMILKYDTVTMRVNATDSFITGDLSYHLYAKDRNEGSIKGVIRDSLIVAYYTFRSEGMLSVRQVAFKLQGTALVEGYGDLNTNSDTVRFKDVHNLSFQYDRPFIKIPCID